MEEPNEPDFLLKQAERCRTVAKSATDGLMRKTLLSMAKDYEDRANALLQKKPK